MRVIKNLSIFIGAVALIAGLNSCKKDNDIECCTFSYIDEDITYTFKACSDGKLTYSYGDETYTESWKDDYDTWSEVKSLMINEYDATCN
jgi:hypothetical protein